MSGRAVCVQCACSVRAGLPHTIAISALPPIGVRVAQVTLLDGFSGGHLLHVSYPLREEGALLHAPPSVELLGALLQQGVRDRATFTLRQQCEVVRMALHLSKTTRHGRPEPAQATDWPRLAEAWGSLRRDLALEAASGEPAG